MLFHLSLAIVAVTSTAPVTFREAYKLRNIVGDPRQHFVEQIGPLTDGIRDTKEIVLREGLPHYRFEGALLLKEMEEKKWVGLHGYPFYDGFIPVQAKVAKRLLDLCADPKTFGPYKGARLCGGFHPDWCVEFRAEKDVYRVHICFGCREARLYGPWNQVYADLDKNAKRELMEMLVPLRKNRPVEEFKDVPPCEASMQITGVHVALATSDNDEKKLRAESDSFSVQKNSKAANEWIYHSTYGMSVERAEELLLGPDGTPVDIRVMQAK